VWPSEDVAANWKVALEEPAHPLHEQVASTLSAFKNNLRGRWRDGAGRKALAADDPTIDLSLSGSEQQQRDRIAWAAFFRCNYRNVVRLSQGRAVVECTE